MVRTRKRKIATLAERILGDTTKEEMNLYAFEHMAAIH